MPRTPKIGLQAVMNLSNFNLGLRGYMGGLRLATATTNTATKTINRSIGGIGSGVFAKLGKAAFIGIASAIGIATAAIVGFGLAGANAAISFESAFAGVVKTVEDISDAEGNLNKEGEKLRSGIRDLAKDIPVTVEELAKIGELAGQFGVAKEGIIPFTRAIAQLGATTNLTVSEAAEQISRFINILGTPVEQVDRIGASIVALGNNFATTEKDILNWSLRIAGIGQVVGLTEAQIFGIGAAFSSVGVQAESGGTAVQKALVFMNQAVATGGDKLEKFGKIAGMTAEEFRASFEKDAGEAFRSFIEGLGMAGKGASQLLQDVGLTDVRLNRAFLGLAGAGDLLARAMGMAEDAYSNINDIAGVVGSTLGVSEGQIISFVDTLKVAADEANLRFDTRSLAAYGAAFSKLGIDAGTAQDAFTEALNQVKWEAAGGGKQLEKFAKIAGVTAADFVLAWRDDPTKAFDIFFSGIKASGASLEEFSSLFPNLNETSAKALFDLASNNQLVVDSFTAIDSAFLKNNALQVEANKRYKTTESQLQLLKNTFNDLAITLGYAILPVLNTFLKAFRPIIDEVGNRLPDALNRYVIPALEDLGSVIEKNLPNALAFLSGMWTNTLYPAIQGVTNFIRNTVVPVFLSIYNAIKGPVGKAFGFIEENSGTLIPLIKGVAGAFLGWMVTLKVVALIVKGILAAKTAIAVFAGAFSGPVGWIALAVAGLAAVWSSNFLGIRDIIQDDVFPVIVKFADFIKQGLPGAMSVVKKIFQDTFGSFDPLTKSFAALWESLKSLWISLAPLLIPVGKILAGIFGGVVLTSISLFLSFVNGVINALPVLLDTVVKVFSGVVDLVGGMADVFIGAFQAFWAWITGDEEGLRKAQEKVSGGAQKIVDAAGDIIVNFFGGLWDTVKTYFETFQDSMVAFWISMWDNVIAETALGEKINTWVTGAFAGIDTILAGLGESAAGAWIQGALDKLGVDTELIDKIKGVFGIEPTKTNVPVQEFPQMPPWLQGGTVQVPVQPIPSKEITPTQESGVPKGGGLMPQAVEIIPGGEIEQAQQQLTNFSTFVSNITNAIAGSFDKAKNAIMPTFEAIGGFFTETLFPFVQKYYDFWWGTVVPLLGSLAEYIGTAWTKAFEIVHDFLEDIGVFDTFNSVVESGKQIIEDLKLSFIEVSTKIGEFLDFYLTPLTDYFNSIWAGAIESATSLIDGLSLGLDRINIVLSQAKDWVDKLTAALKELSYDKLKEMLKAILPGSPPPIAEGLSEIEETAGDSARGIKRAGIDGILEDIAIIFKDKLLPEIDNFVTTSLSLITSIQDIGTAAFNSMTQILDFVAALNTVSIPAALQQGSPSPLEQALLDFSYAAQVARDSFDGFVESLGQDISTGFVMSAKKELARLKVERDIAIRDAKRNLKKSQAELADARAEQAKLAAKKNIPAVTRIEKRVVANAGGVPIVQDVEVVITPGSSAATKKELDKAKDSVSELKDNVTLAKYALQDLLNTPLPLISRLITNLASKLSSITGSFISLYQEKLIDPVVEQLDRLKDKLEEDQDAFNELTDRVKELREAFGAPISDYISYKDALNLPEGKVRSEILASLKAEEEIKTIEQQRREIAIKMGYTQAEIARYAELEADAKKRTLEYETNVQRLKFLETQLDLIELIQERGLDAGKILSGITLGLNASLPQLIDAMNLAITALIKEANDSLEIGSPSKVFARIGENMMKSTAGAVLGQVSDLQLAMKRAMASVIRTGQSLGSSIAGSRTNVYNNNSRVVNLEINPSYQQYQSPADIYYDVHAALGAVRL